jgi:two-component system, NarL family, invasion response regulator UvrY
MDKIKIIVVDDHTLVRKGIVGLLSTMKDMDVIGEASSGEEAISLSKSQKPDVILMDIQMPGMGGLEATRKLAYAGFGSKVLALTVYESDVFPTRFLEEGAAGYITKYAEPRELERAIRMVASGQRYVSSEIAQKLVLRRYSDHEQSPFERLSERELQVMMMITRGKKAPEIADVLHLSPKTINTYRYRIFDKLGVKTDVDLTRLAIRYGLIEAD